MAIERILLRAHHGDTVLPRAFENPVETALEVNRLGHFFIIGDTIVEAMRISRPSAQLLSKKNI